MKKIGKQIILKTKGSGLFHPGLSRLFTGTLLAGILLSVTASRVFAEYHNIQAFSVQGKTTGSAEEPFVWTVQDNAWEIGTGYAWPGKGGIMKWSFETTPDLILTIPLKNGTYDVKVCDVFNSEKATKNSEFLFTVNNGEQKKIVTSEAEAVPCDYDLGTVTVTDGELTIKVGNPTSKDQAWLGFSGFEISEISAPDAK